MSSLPTRFKLKDMILLLLLASFISQTISEPKQVFSPVMCSKNDVNDCSFQFRGFESASCRIYSTSVCKTYDFTSWMDEYPSRSEQESSPSFDVDAVPYQVRAHESQFYVYHSINLTFTTSSDEITGFVFHYLIHENVGTRNICRILDFRNVTRHHGQLSLFYDCCCVLLDQGNNPFYLHVRALPTNEELKYSLRIPYTEETGPLTICQWKPLIMVSLQELENNCVNVKFAQAPEYLNVTGYIVTISEKDDGKMHIIRTAFVKARLEDRSAIVTFESINLGHYYVSVQPDSVDPDCNNEYYLEISIHKKLLGFQNILYIFIIVIVGITVVIGIMLFLQKLPKQNNIPLPLSVLLVHSYDFEKHESTVNSLIMLLKQFCSDVTTIYSRNTDPIDWLEKTYEKASVIIIVISCGAFHKIQNKNDPPITENHTWGDRFSPAICWIRNNIHSTESPKKKIIRIYFEYSHAHHIPRRMRSKAWGKIFCLPKQVNSFIAHLCSNNLKSCLLSIDSLRLKHDISSCEEMKSLWKNVEEVKDTLRHTSEKSLMFQENVPYHHHNFTGPCKQSICHYDAKEKTYNVHFIEGSQKELNTEELEWEKDSDDENPSFWSKFFSSKKPEDTSDEDEDDLDFWENLCPQRTQTSDSRNTISFEITDSISEHSDQSLGESDNFWTKFEKQQNV